MDRDLSRFVFFRGRVGLYAILRALGIGKRDEVATQAFTCLAVPEAIIAAGAKPIYVDIEANGFNMSSLDLIHKITPNTKAIIVQHTYGIPANMKDIISIAEKAKIPIIEDCCHSMSGTFDGKKLGTFGVASFYSFEWGKPIVIGLGGSVTLNDPTLIEKIEDEYEQLQSPSNVTLLKIQLQYIAFILMYRPRYYWQVKKLFHRLTAIGAAKSNYNQISKGSVSVEFNWKMASWLRRRLQDKQRDIDKIVEHSHWVADQYRSKIYSRNIQHPVEMKNCQIFFARYPLLSIEKESLLTRAREINVEISDWYNTPVHPLKRDEWEEVYYEAGTCPNAENTCRMVVTLPTNRHVSESDINNTIDLLNCL